MRHAVDLFAGAGGWTTGAKLAGLRVVWAANHWPAAVAAHRANHPDVHHECQDLMQVDWRMLPDLRDGVLIASPACQGFSPNGRPGRVLGARAAVKHQADRNSTWAVLAAADTARPAAILVENVPDMAAWSLFPSWLGTLRAMGYQVEVQVVNAHDHGVPQDRRRLIIQAMRGRRPRLIEPSAPRRGLGEVLESRAEWQLVAGKPPSMAARMRVAAAHVRGPCFWANVDSARGRGLHEPAPTLTTRSVGQWYLLDGPRCRMLTLRELARIQGFPDSYLLPATRTLAGRLIGNAVPVPMAKAIVSQAITGEARSA